MDEIFRKYFFIIHELLKNCGISYQNVMDFDVAAAVYVISDYAVLSSNGDRYYTDRKMNDEFKYLFVETNYGKKKDASENMAFQLFCIKNGLQASDQTLIKMKRALFDMRIDFYIQIVREGPKTNLCMPLDDSLRDNAMYSVTTAFANCVHTPAYIENYGTAPITLRSIEEKMQLAEMLFLPLYKALTDLFVEVSEFVKKFKERNAAPLPRQYDPDVVDGAKEFEEMLENSSTLQTKAKPKKTKRKKRTSLFVSDLFFLLLAGVVLIFIFLGKKFS